MTFRGVTTSTSSSRPAPTTTTTTSSRSFRPPLQRQQTSGAPQPLSLRPVTKRLPENAVRPVTSTQRAPETTATSSSNSNHGNSNFLLGRAIDGGAPSMLFPSKSSQFEPVASSSQVAPGARIVVLPNRTQRAEPSSSFSQHQAALSTTPVEASDVGGSSTVYSQQSIDVLEGQLKVLRANNLTLFNKLSALQAEAMLRESEAKERNPHADRFVIDELKTEIEFKNQEINELRLLIEPLKVKKENASSQGTATSAHSHRSAAEPAPAPVSVTEHGSAESKSALEESRSLIFGAIQDAFVELFRPLGLSDVTKSDTNRFSTRTSPHAALTLQPEEIRLIGSIYASVLLVKTRTETSVESLHSAIKSMVLPSIVEVTQSGTRLELSPDFLYKVLAGMDRLFSSLPWLTTTVDHASVVLIENTVVIAETSLLRSTGEDSSIWRRAGDSALRFLSGLLQRDVDGAGMTRTSLQRLLGCDAYRAAVNAASDGRSVALAVWPDLVRSGAPVGFPADPSTISLVPPPFPHQLISAGDSRLLRECLERCGGFCAEYGRDAIRFLSRHRASEWLLPALSNRLCPDDDAETKALILLVDIYRYDSQQHNTPRWTLEQRHQLVCIARRFLDERRRESNVGVILGREAASALLKALVSYSSSSTHSGISSSTASRSGSRGKPGNLEPGSARSKRTKQQVS